MHATDLDIDITCPACDADGALDGDRRDACPICDGSGTLNRYQDAPSGTVFVGRLNYYRDGPVIKVERLGQMPIEDDVTGGFNGRFGTFKPSNPNPDYQPDMLDQLNNRPLGTNGPYDLPDDPPYDGATVDAAGMAGGTWPSDADLSISQMIAWAQARGDTAFAETLSHLKTQLGL